MVKNALHTFQENAVQELLKKSTKQILENTTSRDAMLNPIIFSSPTGSGKTIMSISFIQRFRNYLNANISNVVESLETLGHDIDSLNKNLLGKEFNPLYIYFTPSVGELDVQTLNSIKSHKEKGNISPEEEDLNVVDSESVLNNTAQLTKNSVLVIPWDKYIKKNNTINQYTENNMTSTSLDLLITALTKNKNVIAIIDEAHTHFQDKAKFLVSKFKPELLVKMSATPKEAYKDLNTTSKDILNRTVLVPIADVRNSGLIKDKVEIISELNGKPLSLEDCVEMSVELQKELTKLLRYEILNGIAKGVRLTSETIQDPLNLVQVENDSDFKQSRKDYIKKLYTNKGYAESEVVFWLSGDKPNADTLAKAKVLIFKTAVAVGWDCPRSAILVKLREVKSKSFDIQVIGRTLRYSNSRNSMEHRYQDSKLRTSFVFVEGGVSSTDFDENLKSLFGKFVYIDSNNYFTKELKQNALDKFNQIGLKNGNIIKRTLDPESVIFDNIKQSLNISINQEFNNKQLTSFDLSKAYQISINKNYSDNVEEVVKGSYNLQEKQQVNIEDNSSLKNLVDIFLLNALRNSKLKEFELKSSNPGPSITRKMDDTSKKNKRQENLLTIIKKNSKISNFLIDNNFPFSTDLEKEDSICIFLLNNLSFFKDILTRFENSFVDTYSNELETEGSKFSIKNSIYIEDNKFSDSDEQDGWLYSKIPDEISKTSTEEIEFLKFLINHRNVEFVHKNGTDANSFYIIYQDKVTHKNKKYYPDFIVVTKSGKVNILDYKQEAVDQNIYDKFAAGKQYQSENKHLVLENHYTDFVVTMAVNFDKKGDNPNYKFLANPNYISVNASDCTKYWLDIETLLN